MKKKVMSKINYYDLDTGMNLSNSGQDSAATTLPLQAGLQGTTSASVGYYQISAVDETIINLKPEDERAKIIDILDKYGFEIVLNESGDLLGRKKEDTIGWTYCGDLNVSQAILSGVFNRVFTKATESEIDVEIEIIAKKDAFFEDINFVLRPNYLSGSSLSTYSILSNPINSNLIIHLFPDQFFDSLKKAFEEIIDSEGFCTPWTELGFGKLNFYSPPCYFTTNTVDTYTTQLSSNPLTTAVTAKTDIDLIKDKDIPTNYGSIF